MQKPGISQKAFCDVRFSEIDFEKNSLYVVEKFLITEHEQTSSQ